MLERGWTRVTADGRVEQDYDVEWKNCVCRVEVYLHVSMAGLPCGIPSA